MEDWVIAAKCRMAGAVKAAGYEVQSHKCGSDRLYQIVGGAAIR